MGGDYWVFCDSRGFFVGEGDGGWESMFSGGISLCKNLKVGLLYVYGVFIGWGGLDIGFIVG